ncbi:DUF4145 domain-containing protein [Micromonospora sp. NPDC007271]|uniref:DUF4145 domain-containing protein n=1 Tax=Micromonospora sp. NPDC007271 TaxID=3154587 RepID=UPI0033D42690
MKAFEIIATLVAALAWPIVVLVVIFVFRQPIRQLAAHDPRRRPLRRAKVGPVEMEWDSLDEARTEAAADQDSRLGNGSRVSEAFEDLLPLAGSHPTAAVMLAAQRVEAALAKALKVNGIDPLKYSFGHMVNAAMRHGLITVGTERVLHNLRVLRNQVAHSHEPEAAGVTPARATDYVTTAASMADVLASTILPPDLPRSRQDPLDPRSGALDPDPT